MVVGYWAGPITVVCGIGWLALGGIRLWQGRRQVLREYRKANGLCMACGYDIRATPDRCSECGAIPRATH
jgi:hypothetical protein